MFAIVTLLIVITLSILITRIATIALVHTGLSRESARFQARSALTGSGFTTSESEIVVNHPVRRRIIMFLMLLGNAGIVTAISSLILTFINQQGSFSITIKMLVLILGLVLLAVFAHSAWVDRRLSYLIDRFLKKYTRLDVQDYVSLMHLAGNYRLAELSVEEGDWIASKTLMETELGKEGLLVLGIKRPDGTYVGAPRGSTLVLANDTLIVYGRLDEIEKVDRRRRTKAGDRQHQKAIAEQQKILQQEIEIDPAARFKGD